MHRLFAVLLVLTTPLPLRGGDDARTELKALQGTWKAVGLEAGGQPLAKEAVGDFTFVVGADGKATGKMARSEYQARVIVDPQKDPKTIDNVHETGQHKGKKQFGIYKLEGDKWTVCMTPPGAAASARPKSFDTKNTGNVVFIFERVK
jgi:uncharacterized protein (TIGR03067 family)